VVDAPAGDGRQTFSGDVSEEDTLSGELVEVGGFDTCGAIAAEVVGAEGVSDDDDEVETVRF